MKSDSLRQLELDKGTIWFRRFVRDAKALSPHIRFKRAKYGFYRVYWVGDGHPAYLGECYKEMQQIGYEVEEKNFYLESKGFYEEFEDNANLIRKIKNFTEGYWDNMRRLTIKVYMLKNNEEFRKEAQKAYAWSVVK